MVRSAAALFRRQGYAATGWRQVIADGGAPWGSQAHHFPGGKEQLGCEAVMAAGKSYESLLRKALASTDPASAVQLWAAAAGHELERSGWRNGCPVATVALETAGESHTLASACDAAFRSWRGVLVDAFGNSGLARDNADGLALTVLAGMEGALLLARAARDKQVLHTIGEQLAELIRSRLPSDR